MAEIKSPDTIVVIGLGRFGGAVAQTLIDLNHDVLAIDSDPAVVQRWSDRLSYVVEADATDTDTLTALGVNACQRAVVCIGDDIEASVLTVLALDELGIGQIWAKSITVNHGTILKRIGAHSVVSPEAAMGERVAHLVTGEVVDFFKFEEAFAMAKIIAPNGLRGKSIGDCALAEKHGVTVIGIEKGRGNYAYAKPDLMIDKNDLLIVAGPAERVEKFSGLGD